MALNEISPVFPSFGGGVLSPTMWGRENLGKFQTGLARADNCLIKLSGPVVNRSGFCLLGAVIDGPARPIPYQDRLGNGYMLWFAEGYMYVTDANRMLRDSTNIDPATYPYDNGPLVALATGLTYAQVEIMDYAQDPEFLYLAAKGVAPKRVYKGTAEHDWFIEDVPFEPYLSAPENIIANVLGPVVGSPNYTIKYKVATTTIPELGSRDSFAGPEVSVVTDNTWVADRQIAIYWNLLTDTGAYTFTPSGSGTAEYYLTLFGGGQPFPDMIQSVLETLSATAAPTDMDLGVPGALTAGQWGWGDNDSLGFDTVYVRLSDSTAPSSKPSYYLTYIDAGEYEYKVFKNDAGFFGRILTTDIPYALDNNITPETDSTPKVDRNPFTSSEFYPAAVGVFQQRLGFAGSSATPQQVEWSASGAFNDFTQGRPPAPDDSFASPLYSNEYAEIYFLVALRKCLVFTKAGTFVLGSTSDAEGLSFTTQRYDIQDADGVARVKPVVVKDTVLYVDGTGRRINDAFYQLESEGFSGQDLTVLSEHLFKTRTVKRLVYSKGNHDQVVYALCEDGALLPMTYNRHHQMWAWAGPVMTNGFIEDVAVLPSEGGDRLMACIKREGRYYMEYLEDRDLDANIDESVFVDHALRSSGNRVFDAPVPIFSVSGNVMTFLPSDEYTAASPASFGKVRLSIRGAEDTTYNSPYNATWDYVIISKVVGNEEIYEMTLEDPEGILSSADELSTFISGTALFRSHTTMDNWLANVAVPATVGVSDGAMLTSADITHQAPQYQVYGLSGDVETDPADSQSVLALDSLAGVYPAVGTEHVLIRSFIPSAGMPNPKLAFRTYVFKSVLGSGRLAFTLKGGNLDGELGETVGAYYMVRVRPMSIPSARSTVIGLPYKSTVETLPLASATQSGAIGNRQKKATKDDFRFYKTRGVKVGIVGSGLTEVLDAVNPMFGEPPLMSTGLTSINLVGNFTKEGQIRVEQENPFPMALLAHIPVYKVGGVYTNG